MRDLRAPYGCPWDRKQTHRSLRGYLLEETYEVLETIDRGHFDELPGELGDVLLQCVFHAQLAAEAGRFDIVTVVDRIVTKLVERHPHVFTPAGRPLRRASSTIRTPAAVKEQWERIKARERETAGRRKHVLSDIPRALPALLRAHKIGTRVASVGFDWTTAGDVVGKIEEEIAELREALGQSPERAAEEMGDLLFTIANLSRKLGVDAELALAEANDKFTRRFDDVERVFEAEGRSVHDARPEELERAWNKVKRVHR
jgi:MazG family protein